MYSDTEFGVLYTIKENTNKINFVQIYCFIGWNIHLSFAMRSAELLNKS